MTIKTTDPNDYTELLDVFRIGLIQGIIDKQEISKWADVIIQSDAEPDYAMIEISLAASRNNNEILELLNAYIGERIIILAGRVVLGILYRKLVQQQTDLKQIVTGIWQLIKEDKLYNRDTRLFYRIDERYDLAAAGISGSIQDVTQYTLKMLELYNGFTLENASEWEMISRQVDSLVDGFDGYRW